MTHASPYSTRTTRRVRRREKERMILDDINSMTPEETIARMKVLMADVERIMAELLALAERALEMAERR